MKAQTQHQDEMYNKDVHATFDTINDKLEKVLDEINKLKKICKDTQKMMEIELLFTDDDDDDLTE